MDRRARSRRLPSRLSPLLGGAAGGRVLRDRPFFFSVSRQLPDGSLRFFGNANLSDGIRLRRNAIARFDQVQGVTTRERDNAWRRIRAAARHYGVSIEVRGWRSLMKGGRAGRRTLR